MHQSKILMHSGIFMPLRITEPVALTRYTITFSDAIPRLPSPEVTHRYFRAKAIEFVSALSVVAPDELINEIITQLLERPR